MRATILLCLLLLMACQRGPSPHLPQVSFLGKVGLLQEGVEVIPRYEVGGNIRLLLESGKLKEGECDPLGGGHLQVVFTGEKEPGITVELALDGSTLTPVLGGWLLTLPTSAGGEALRLEQVGPHTLTLHWSCAPPEKRVQSHQFSLEVGWPFDQDPRTEARRTQLTTLKDLPPAESLIQLESLATAESDPHLRVGLWMKGVSFHRGHGNFATMEACALKAREAARLALWPSEEIRALNAAHEAARDQGLFTRAREYLHTALELDQRWGYLARLHLEWYSLSMLSHRLGDRLASLDAAQEALTYASRTGNTRFTWVTELWVLELLTNLGRSTLVRQRLGELSIPLAGSGEVDADLLTNAGWMMLRTVPGLEEPERSNTLQKADQYLAAALAAYEASQNTPDMANVLTNQAEVARRRGDIVRSRELATRALALASPTDEELGPHLQLLQCDLAMAEHKTEEARVLLTRLEENTSVPAAYRGAAALGLGKLQRELGQLDLARATFDRALTYRASDPAALSPLHRASLLGGAAEQDAAAITIRLDQHNNESALELVEQLGWQRRLAATRVARRSSLSPDIQEEVRHLERELDSLDQELSRLNRLPISPQVQLQRAQVQQQREQTWSNLRLRSGTATPGQPPSLDLQRIRAGLSPDEVVLRLVSLPEELVVWEVGSGGFTTRRLPLVQTRLEQDIHTFTLSCQRGQPDEEVGQRLARDLLGPHLQHVPAHLTLVVEGALRQLAWSALPTPKGPLLHHSLVSFRPELLSTPKTLNTSGPLLVVADPAHDLPEAYREGVQLTESLLKGAQLLTREAATRDEVRHQLSGARLFHYAGHGATNPTRPWSSHLRLSREEWLSLMDIQGLELNSPLVFLNACEAGQVAPESGGALSLADGFVDAGAAAVIASRWDLPDRAATQVASSFYTYWMSGVSLDEALGKALRDLSTRRGEPASSVSVWSAYLLVGSPQ